MSMSYRGPTDGCVGDHFQTVVDVEATLAEAERLVVDVRDWLISAGIVSAELTDCVLGADLGHPPGRSADEVVVGGYSWKHLWTNGLEIEVGRTVFDAGQGEPWAVTCPYCTTEVPLVDEQFVLVAEAWRPFADVLDGWAQGRDAVMPCAACGRSVRPVDWQWADDYFALGHLGFTFWNWPPFRAEFVAEFGRRFGGHRVVLLAGKL